MNGDFLLDSDYKTFSHSLFTHNVINYSTFFHPRLLVWYIFTHKLCYAAMYHYLYVVYYSHALMSHRHYDV